ncbi:molybdopterin cofactor-binding domain-containing protein [Aliiglaciecola sp. NS0011-25]|uniref:xanthine dehydrogenase family protein molybdopterin-binding subunit n=1 Tax=Aliiglaciecola sp. NS0011-25 TaxID=3127654 RepID=UPI0031044E04
MSEQSKTQTAELGKGSERRTFLKASLAVGGGLMLNFSWFGPSFASETTSQGEGNHEFELNAYLTINTDGSVTASVPNPEFGQNLMTSMPMILADELDVDWRSVSAVQAPYNESRYEKQFSGGSQSIRGAWQSLRMAGASAREMLKQAAANHWQVPVNSINTDKGRLIHQSSGRELTYAEVASSAAQLAVPKNVELKKNKDFSLIGGSQKNLVGEQIVSGKPLFGIDYCADNMLIAMIVHPPAFGQELESFDESSIVNMPGIVNVFAITSLPADYVKNYFDGTAFPKLVAIVGRSTWQVMNAKKALQTQWRNLSDKTEKVDNFGNIMDVKVPGGLESTSLHEKAVNASFTKNMQILRQDGDPDAAFSSASKVIEREYFAPYLAHNTLEPMNFFAHVTDQKVKVAGPLQGPVFIKKTLQQRLQVPAEKIEIEMTRMGGGFGRRAYCHYVVEAALISKQVKAPIKLIYAREDDMTMGIYRPTYTIKLRAALDESDQLVAYHVQGSGVPEHCVHPNRFPAGAVPNYLAQGTAVDSNITVGAFRAPGSNFMASAEQSFLDEVAEAANTDPIDFRLALLEKAKSNPVGENNDYDPVRYAGVLNLVRAKSGWDTLSNNINKGVAAYFCHNSYAAHVITMAQSTDKARVESVTSAIDCGIVVNLDSAKNMVEGAVIDGIGNAMYGEMTFTDGKPDKQNFDRYRIIRMDETPAKIDVHFVDSLIDPTGLGEPPFPPIFPALANALYQSLGKRLYRQPFIDYI